MSWERFRVSPFCSEHSRIMVIQRPVLREPAMEGTSDAAVSLNSSCGQKRRTVIRGTCGGNHYRKPPCWNRSLWLDFKSFRRLFSNFRHVFNKTLFSTFKIFIMYLAIFVVYLAKPFIKYNDIFLLPDIWFVDPS